MSLISSYCGSDRRVKIANLESDPHNKKLQKFSLQQVNEAEIHYSLIFKNRIGTFIDSKNNFSDEIHRLDGMGV